MRILIIAIFILYTGCKPVSPALLESALQCNSSLSAVRRINATYYRIIQSIFYRNSEEQFSQIQFVTKSNSYYLIICGDTIHNPCWDKYSLNDYYDSLTESISYSGKIFSIDSLTSLIETYGKYNAITHHIINFPNEGPRDKLRLCDLIPVQLDADKKMEYIVAFQGGWNNHHYIFDDADSGWKLHGKQEVPCRIEPHPIDTSLPGYFGLRESGWGTGLSSQGYAYFKLTADSFNYCFSVNTYYSQWMFSLAGKDYGSFMHASGKGEVVNNQRVRIAYDIWFELTDPEYDTAVVFRHNFNRVIEYVEIETDSPYSPDNSHTHTGFENGGYNYYPEIDMMNQLCHIKFAGTKRQQYYLRDLNCDITFYR